MKKYIINLLRAAINNTAPDFPPENIEWKNIYTVAVYNSIAATIYPAVLNLPKEHQPNKEIINLLLRHSMIAGGIDSMQEYEAASVMDSFEKQHILYVPLKGWFMKQLYPSSHMRTMCDVDILVQKSDLPAIAAILKKHDFILEAHGGNHDAYIKSDKISIEIHWSLFTEDSPYYDFFTDVMKRLVDEDGKTYMKRLSKEDYYLHLIAHLAKHFEHSGTGIRSLLDIWLYNEAYRDTLDNDYLSNGLSMLGLEKFEPIINNVAAQLFSGCAWDDVTYTVTEYVMSSGTYGKQDTNITAGVLRKDGSKLLYIISRLFPKSAFLVPQFPILEKYPVFLPACWFARILRCIFKRRAIVHSELSILRNIDDNSLDENNKIKKLCGLS